LKQPRDRIAFLLSDSQAKILITDEVLDSLCPTFSLNESFLEGQDSSNLNFYAPLDAPIYIIYTSGSTGIPKGVIVQQKTVLNMIRWYHDFFQITVDDRASQFTAPIFDVFFCET